MTNSESSFNEKLLEVIRLQQNTIDVQKETINTQKATINTLVETNSIYSKIVDIKDQTIDKQLQMLQIMELELKELGYPLGDAPIF